MTREDQSTRAETVSLLRYQPQTAHRLDRHRNQASSMTVQ